MKKIFWAVMVFFLAGGNSLSTAASKDSMQNLLASGKSLQCTFEKDDAGTNQKGTLYIASDRMRGDFDVQSSDGEYPMHMIREGNTSYMWGGPMGENTGMKMEISSNGAQAPQHGPDMNEEMDFECQPWNVDASKFVPPANVEFQDMSAMMGQLQQAGGAGQFKEMQCAACDQAPPDSRQECLQAMGCA